MGDVRTVAVSDDGIVYVGDRIGATVRAYNPDGTFVVEIAQEGEGPGEVYGWPANLTLDSDGRLYVRDAKGVMIFAPSGEQAIADSVVGGWQIAASNLTSAKSSVGVDGRYYHPSGAFPPNEPPEFFFEIFGEGSPTGDTLRVPAQPGLEGRRRAFFVVEGAGGRMVEGLSRVPFSAVPSWAVTVHGTLLSTTGREDQLHEVNVLGDTVRSIRLSQALRRVVPTSERADSIRALRERMDSLPVPIDEVIYLGEGVADIDLPTVLPRVLSVASARNGVVWIEHWPPEGEAGVRLYSVLDIQGVSLAQVVLEAPLLSEPPPYFSARYVAGVVEDPGTGVHSVAVFALPDTLVR